MRSYQPRGVTRTWARAADLGIDTEPGRLSNSTRQRAENRLVS